MLANPMRVDWFLESQPTQDSTALTEAWMMPHLGHATDVLTSFKDFSTAWLEQCKLEITRVAVGVDLSSPAASPEEAIAVLKQRIPYLEDDLPELTELLMRVNRRRPSDVVPYLNQVATWSTAVQTMSVLTDETQQPEPRIAYTAELSLDINTPPNHKPFSSKQVSAIASELFTAANELVKGEYT